MQRLRAATFRLRIRDLAERSPADRYLGAGLRRTSRGDYLGPGDCTGSPGAGRGRGLRPGQDRRPRRLRSASETLPDGIRFLVIAGHRSSTEQARRFALHEDRLRRSGTIDPEELRRRASAFVSPVEVAPHCAGAALDLTLTDADGAELDMGGAVNGHRTGDEKYCPLNAEGLSARARHNRDLLARAIGSVGFINYPTEWWHWSFGDRYWALITGADSAIYGRA